MGARGMIGSGRCADRRLLGKARQTSDSGPAFPKIEKANVFRWDYGSISMGFAAQSEPHAAWSAATCSRRSARAQSTALFVGLDVHKDSIAVAHAAGGFGPV